MGRAERRVPPIDEREVNRVLVIGPCFRPDAYEATLVEIGAGEVDR
jgi:hypothetical protein